MYTIEFRFEIVWHFEGSPVKKIINVLFKNFNIPTQLEKFMSQWISTILIGINFFFSFTESVYLNESFSKTVQFYQRVNNLVEKKSFLEGFPKYNIFEAKKCQIIYYISLMFEKYKLSTILC